MKGILFSKELLPKVFSGEKTVTRRLWGLKEINQEPEKWTIDDLKAEKGAVYHTAKPNKRGQFVFFTSPILHDAPDMIRRFAKPRFRVGEVAFVKEVWRVMGVDDNEAPCELSKQNRCLVQYKLDNQPSCTDCIMGKWRSPLFMPEWAARNFIKILDVRPERLQEITEADAIAEGSELGSARGHYSIRWDNINPAFPWASNPWCWRYEFVVVKK